MGCQAASLVLAPNIFLFIDALLEIQERSHTKMLSVATVKPRKKRIEKENYIYAVTSMNDFENDVIDKFTKVSTKENQKNCLEKSGFVKYCTCTITSFEMI